MLSLRSTMSSRAASPRRLRLVLTGWLLTLFVAAAALVPQPAQARPSLILPTPPGEPWRVIQGYACGTHNAWDRYSLDLVQVNGPTYNAPIRAAASGTIWYWESGSGTLIVNHGGQFFTMYTHMARAVSTAQGRQVEVGETIGFAGDRATAGAPHLHFTAFTANRDGWSGRHSIPLSFAEGYNLPELGGCNQHGGTVMTAQSLRDPEVSFQSAAQAERWYNSDQRVEFTSNWSGGGLSQAWDKEPDAEMIMFAGATDGYANLAEFGEGQHMLYVRVWGPDGRQTLASYGPLGFDQTAPMPPEPIAEVRAAPGPISLSWAPATDALAGIAGYRVYVGADPEGSSEWFSAEPGVKMELLNPGQYMLRVQSLDHAGNSSAWTTIGTLVVEVPSAD